MSIMRVTSLCVVSVVMLGDPVHGQAALTTPRLNMHVTIPRVILPPDLTARNIAYSSGRSDSRPAASRPLSLRAFGIEALGGSAGSALGFGAVRLLADEASCGDNLSCSLSTAGSAVLLATVASAGGSYAAGRLGGTSPNGAGSALGAVAGAAAMVGVDHVLSNVDVRDTSRYIAYAVSQGLLTALGSRIGALVR
jgi:hypothetical protein